MTANPKWPEVTEACTYYVNSDPSDPTVKFTAEPGFVKVVQPATDRPDIVARVFDLKKDALLKKIVQGTVYTILSRAHTRFRQVLRPDSRARVRHRIPEARCAKSDVSVKGFL